MENASDALIMAFGALIFVLALSISISLLGQVNETSNIVFSLKDRENDYIYVDFNANDDSARKVGVETVISSMYRAYRENYKIVFFKKVADTNEPFYIYTSKKAGDTNEIYSVDEAMRGEKWMELNNYSNFLNYLISGTTNEYFNKKLTNGLYNELASASTITEHLGEYYEDDLRKKNDEGTNAESNANKLKKRIIAYVIE